MRPRQIRRAPERSVFDYGRDWRRSREGWLRVEPWNQQQNTEENNCASYTWDRGRPARSADDCVAAGLRACRFLNIVADGRQGRPPPRSQRIDGAINDVVYGGEQSTHRRGANMKL